MAMENKKSHFFIFLNIIMLMLNIYAIDVQAVEKSMQIAYTQASSSNLRADWTPYAEIVNKLPINTKVNVLEKFDDRVSIQVSGDTSIQGWLHESLIAGRPITLEEALKRYKALPKTSLSRLKWIERAAAIAPKDFYVLNELVRTLKVQGEYAQAELVQKNLEVLHPKLPELIRLPFDSVLTRYGALSMSSNGTTAAHINELGTVVVWSTEDSKILFTSGTEDKKAKIVALNPNGTGLAIGFFPEAKAGGTITYRTPPVEIWSLKDKRLIQEVEMPNEPVHSLAFSPDGKRLVVGMQKKSEIWNFQTGEKIREFPTRLDPEGWDGLGLPVSIEFASEGRALLVSEWFTRQYDVDRGAILWDMSSGLELWARHVTPPNGDSIRRPGLALGLNGRLLAYSARDGLVVERLDICDSTMVMPFGGYADTVAVDPLGRWIATVGIDQQGYQLKIANTSNSKKIYSVSLSSKVLQLETGGDGRHLIVLIASNDDPSKYSGVVSQEAKGELYWLSLPETLLMAGEKPVIGNDTIRCKKEQEDLNELNLKMPDHPVRLSPKAILTHDKTQDVAASDMYFNAKGELYALYRGFSNVEYSENLRNNPGVIVWDINTLQPIHVNQGVYVGDRSIRLNNGWGYYDGVKHLHDYVTGEKHHIESEDFHYSQFKSDQDTGDLYLLRKSFIEHYSNQGKHLQDIKFKGRVTSFTARNGRVAVLIGNKVMVWRIGEDPLSSPRTYHLEDLAGDHEYSENLLLSGDGQFLRIDFPNASGDGPTGFGVYRLKTGEHVGDGGMLTPFPKNANRGVVLGRYRNSLDVWDYDQGKKIAHLPVHSSESDDRFTFSRYSTILAAFNDNGRYLASVVTDGSIRLWDINERRLIGVAKASKPVTAIAFNDSGNLLAAGTEDGNIQLFDLIGDTNRSSSN